jgi:predicted amino acid racemase
MFLDVIRRRNPRLIEVAIALHQAGRIPPNAYVIDLDAVEANARLMRQRCDRLGLRVFAMTKQVGRNPDFCRAVMAGGIDAAVAVDMDCARSIRRAAMKLGHIGHLVQVPRAEADEAVRLRPEYWTIFSEEKAREACSSAGKMGTSQALLARIHSPGDIFYKGHEGGFKADDIVAIADRIDRMPHGRFTGITTFPALLFDSSAQKVAPTHNLKTIEEAARQLRASGRQNIQVNAPGTTSSVVLDALANAGATQVEPGHGLTGTTPLHASEDLPELPAVVYITEISHFAGGRAYCYGGGLYIDPVFPPYPLKAIVSAEPTVAEAAKLAAEIPPAEAIDYYGMIDVPRERNVQVGDSVVFGFRIQAFVTRASVVGLAGTAEPCAVYNGFGDLTNWRAEPQ